jgi:hypothetical protein
MKKLLLSACILLSGIAFAQKDISVTLSSPAQYSSVVNGVSFAPSGIITNLGAALTANDTIVVLITLNNNPVTYTSGGTQYYWGIIVAHGAVATNATLPFTLSPSLSFNITTFSGATMCAVASLQNGGNVDGNTTNNTSCNAITLSVHAGVNEVSGVANSVKVYPNPARDMVNFSVDGEVAKTITIMDITGKQVENIVITSGNTQVNVGNYTGGIYLYQIKSEDGQVIKSGKFNVVK